MSRSSMLTRVSLAVALLFVSASLLDAQEEGRRGRGGRGGGFGFGRGGGNTVDKMRLVGVEPVQKEIKVTDEQKTKIDGILSSYREESRGLFQGLGLGNFQDMSAEERREAMEKVSKKRAEITASFEKKIDELLQEPQVKRLNEIALQQKGAQALTDGPVAASLKLSEEQIGKIKAVYTSHEDAVQKLREDIRGGGGGREAFAEMREKQDKLQKESDTKALAVLSKEQNEQFTALKGKEFALDPQALRGGFGRGGRGEGRGGGQRGDGDGGGGGGQRRRPPVDDA